MLIPRPNHRQCNHISGSLSLSLFFLKLYLSFQSITDVTSSWVGNIPLDIQPLLQPPFFNISIDRELTTSHKIEFPCKFK